MRLLLDTHVLLWALFEPLLIGERIRLAMADRRNSIFVSSISVYETLQKFRLGKLPGAERFVADPYSSLAKLQAEDLPVNHAHARLAGTILNIHCDPFDRIIAAQSIIEGLTVVTTDRQIAALGATTIW